MTQIEYVSRCSIVNNNFYSYDSLIYNNTENKVTVTCPKHGNFQVRAEDHIQGHGCPACGNSLSNAENEIVEFIKGYIGSEKVIQRDRNVIKPLELDIYIPSLNAAIEYNGLLWHSKKYKSNNNYHLNKLNACKNNGIKLLQIFEDEYANHKDIVLNKIKHILKLEEQLPRIMGRKCIIKEIDKNMSKIFLTQYHIQGYSNSTTYLGAFYGDKLIAVMTFKIETKDGLKWELTRFASDYNYICQGIGGKLFKYFITHYECSEIKSFADRRWTIDEENNIYLQLGFKFNYYTRPDYHYYSPKEGTNRIHKFRFRKNRLHEKYGLPLSMTESEMVNELGYYKVYDCGLIKYVWKKER